MSAVGDTQSRQPLVASTRCSPTPQALVSLLCSIACTVLPWCHDIIEESAHVSKSEVGSALPLMMTAVACYSMAGGQVAHAATSAVKLCMQWHACMHRQGNFSCSCMAHGVVEHAVTLHVFWFDTMKLVSMPFHSSFIQQKQLLCQC